MALLRKQPFSESCNDLVKTRMGNNSVNELSPWILKWKSLERIFALLELQKITPISIINV